MEGDEETRGGVTGHSSEDKASGEPASEGIRSEVISAIISCLKLKEDQIQVLSGTTNLAKDFNLDSLDFVDLIMSLEEKFSIEISDEEAQALETVDDICEYIQKKADA